MPTFLDMQTRIMAELRRSNATSDVKNAINDAIADAAVEHFFFNEMRTSFPTVAGQEYYDDLGLTNVDAIWYTIGTSRYDLRLVNNIDLDNLAFGNPVGGQLELLSRVEGKLRLYPIPNSVITVNLSGYGKLTPSPLVNDADTNAWVNEAERYIRALAKRNYLRDVVRDYGEARVYDAVAEEYKDKLVEQTALKESTGVIKGTSF